MKSLYNGFSPETIIYSYPTYINSFWIVKGSFLQTMEDDMKTSMFTTTPNELETNDVIVEEHDDPHKPVMEQSVSHITFTTTNSIPP